MNGAADESTSDLGAAEVFASPFACACLRRHLMDCFGTVQRLIGGIDQAAERDVDDPLLQAIEDRLKASRAQLREAAELALQRENTARRRRE